MRRIDADALKDFIENRYTITWEADTYEAGIKDACTDILKFINEQPTLDEECEYVITKGKAGYHEEYKCSACGDSFYWTQDRNIPRKFNYCRNCGRKVIRFIEKEKE